MGTHRASSCAYRMAMKVDPVRQGLQREVDMLRAAAANATTAAGRRESAAVPVGARRRARSDAVSAAATRCFATPWMAAATKSGTSRSLLARRVFYMANSKICIGSGRLMDSAPRCRDKREPQGDAPAAGTAEEEADRITQAAAAATAQAALSPQQPAASSRDSSHAAANEAVIMPGPAQPSTKQSREIGWSGDKQGGSGVQQVEFGSMQSNTAARRERAPVARSTVRRLVDVLSSRVQEG